MILQVVVIVVSVNVVSTGITVIKYDHKCKNKTCHGVSHFSIQAKNHKEGHWFVYIL